MMIHEALRNFFQSGVVFHDDNLVHHDKVNAEFTRQSQLSRTQGNTLSYSQQIGKR
jgi:hypothetical protein